MEATAYSRGGHAEPHPLAGRTVRIRDGVRDPAQNQVAGGAEYRLEDWWDRVSGGSWMTAQGNPAALHYAMRTAFSGDVPTDDEVVYGKIGHLGHLVHVSELDGG
jgi:hypothetical protein